VFGGQWQGGISTPSDLPVVFLFSGDSGDQYGYADTFRPLDGLFLYTGEGQIGDMNLQRGNASIVNAERDGKRIHLFQNAKKGYVTYLGEVAYVGHHTETRPDRDGNERKAIVFELALESSQQGNLAVNESQPLSLPAKESLTSKTLSELRALAVLTSGRGVSASMRKQVCKLRSEAVKEYARRRAKGRCEGCEAVAPFKTKKGRPYLEPHHLTRLADDGPDHPENVIALCPTCHRRAHHAADAEAFNEGLKHIVAELEMLPPLSPEFEKSDAKR
jgi:5-methylcytosine-specific restriction protein A